MPRIPLADIPNAPRAPDMPLANYPNFRVDFSGMADSLKQHGISEQPYQAEASGLGQIGRAIEQVGGIANQFAMQKLEAQNVIDVAKAENLMADYSARKQGEMQTLPPDQWNDHFSKDLPELQKQIDALGVSPRAADDIEARYTRWSGHARVNIQADAAKTAIENGRQEIKVARYRAGKEGDTEQFVRLGQSAVKSGLMTQAEVDQENFEFQQEQKQAALQSANLSNPFELQTEMEAAAKRGDGETESFGKLHPAEVKKWLYAARQESRNQQIEARQDITNAIYSGDIIDEQQIRDMAGKVRLPEGEIKSMTRLLTREVQFDPEAATKLKTDVLGYDAETDKDMSTFNRLNTQIETGLPKTEASALKSALFQSWQQTIRENRPKDKRQAFEADLLKQFDTLGDQGLLGKTGIDPKTKKIVDEDTRMKLWSDVETKKSQMSQWLKENRNATPEQAKQQFMDIVGGDAAKNAAQVFDSMPQRPAQPKVINAGPYAIPIILDNKQKVSDSLVNTVKGLEGFSDKAFADFKQHSIGYGTRAKSPNEQITQAEADRRLREELSVHADNVDKTASGMNLKLTPGQRDALISFDFNTGKGAFLLETSGGDMNKVRERMKLYKNVTQNGKLVASQGLVNRRAAEDKMFVQ